MHLHGNPGSSYDNARSHASAVEDLLRRWQWKILEHPPYSPDMCSCDYDLFAKMKEPLRGTRHNTRDELIRAIERTIRNINKDGRADGERRLKNIWQKALNKGATILKVHTCYYHDHHWRDGPFSLTLASFLIIINSLRSMALFLQFIIPIFRKSACTSFIHRNLDFQTFLFPSNLAFSIILGKRASFVLHTLPSHLQLYRYLYIGHIQCVPQKGTA